MNASTPGTDRRNSGEHSRDILASLDYSENRIEELIQPDAVYSYSCRIMISARCRLEVSCPSSRSAVGYYLRVESDLNTLPIAYRLERPFIVIHLERWTNDR